jgi:hypothetical protein
MQRRAPQYPHKNSTFSLAPWRHRLLWILGLAAHAAVAVFAGQLWVSCCNERHQV